MKETQLSAGGIVMRGGPGAYEVLLIKDRFGFWTWPKGHLESEETPEQAAVREIFEETGVSGVKILCEIGKQEYSFVEAERDIFKTVSLFLMELKGEGSIKARYGEISSAGWFKSEEALKKIGYEGSASILSLAIEKYKDIKGK